MEPPWGLQKATISLFFMQFVFCFISPSPSQGEGQFLLTKRGGVEKGD